jgi:hypothetical protein
MLNFKKDDMNFQLAKDLYDIGEMKEEIYIQYLTEEMARNRTSKGINRV